MKGQKLLLAINNEVSVFAKTKMKYAKADDYVGIVKQRKVIDGKLYRQYFTNSKGVDVGIPVGIHIRKDNSVTYAYVKWNKINHSPDAGAYVPYIDRITQENALVKCINIMAAYGKGKCPTCCTTRTKGRTKALHPAFVVDISDVPTGVYVFTSASKQTTQMSINVSVFDLSKGRFCRKTIYVGTINNWKERYEQKLEEAIEIRNESLKTYNELTKATT